MMHIGRRIHRLKERSPLVNQPYHTSTSAIAPATYMPAAFIAGVTVTPSKV